MDNHRVLESNIRMQDQLSNVIRDIQYIQKNCYNQSVASYHNKVLEKLNPLSIITKKLIRHYKKQDFINMSLIPIIRQFLLDKIHNLAQIQFEYNPFQRSLIQLPSGVKITQVISNCIKEDSLLSMFQYLMYQQLKNNPQRMTVALQYLHPIFSHSLEVAKYYSFTLNPANLKQILWNYDIYTLAGTQQQFMVEQNEIVTDQLKKYGSVRVTNNKKITTDFKRIIGQNLLKRKRVSVENKRFFGEPQQYENQVYDSINNAFQEQIMSLKHMDIENPSTMRKVQLRDLEKQRLEIINQSKSSQIQSQNRSNLKPQSVRKSKLSNLGNSKLFSNLKKFVWSNAQNISKISEATQ